jgi:hypothetical protein
VTKNTFYKQTNKKLLFKIHPFFNEDTHTQTVKHILATTIEKGSTFLHSPDMELNEFSFQFQAVDLES